MEAAHPPRAKPRRELAFKGFLFALLAANTAYFAIAGTTSKAVDAAAWLTLLALFQAEMLFGRHLATRGWRVALRAARLLAAAGVFAATIGYVFEDNVLDAVNCVLWIAVVVLLETGIRFPRSVGAHPHAFNAVAVALYVSLGVLVMLWAYAGMWFDAYDAVLWLTAFALLEIDISAAAKTPDVAVRR